MERRETGLLSKKRERLLMPLQCPHAHMSAGRQDDRAIDLGGLCFLRRHAQRRAATGLRYTRGGRKAARERKGLFFLAVFVIEYFVVLLDVSWCPPAVPGQGQPLATFLLE